MTFADEYREYRAWAASVDDTPEAWEGHRELVKKAEAFDAVLLVYNSSDEAGDADVGYYNDVIEGYLGF